MATAENVPLDYDRIADAIRRAAVLPEWLSPQQAGEYVGIPTKTLEQYRAEERGPAFSKVGRHVRYARRDLDDWMRSHRAGGAI